MVTIFDIIERNKDEREFLVAVNSDMEAIAADFKTNRHLWRVTTAAETVRFVRMGGGAGATSHNGYNDEMAAISTFIIPRDRFPEFYCEYVQKGLSCRPSLKRIQAYQKEFDAKKDGTVKSVPFTDHYALVCLSEELGELARAMKKGARAVINGDAELAAYWKNEERREATDQFVYLVKLFNKNGWDLADSYYEIMEANHGELDKGGGKYLGTAKPEDRPKVEIMNKTEVN